MMFRITQIAILILVFILFVFKDSGIAAVSPHSLPDPTSSAYKNLAEMRKNVGLDTSSEAINRLYAEQGPNPGFAMIEEQAIFGSLSDIEAQITNIRSTLSPNNYGGVYIKSADRKVVIKLVNSTPELKAQITAQAKFPASLQFEEAQFTKAELDTAQKLIEGHWNDIPNLTSLGVDIMKNRLNIGFNISEQQSMESRKQIEKLLNPQMLAYSFDLKPVAF